MVEYSLEELIRMEVSKVKRNCVLCMGRAHLRDNTKERSTALNAAKKLVELYENKFNLLRRKDADAALIHGALGSKRLCMNAVDLCNECDMEVDRINREMNKLL